MALHQVTDDFIAYTRAIGSELGLDETTTFLVVAATLLDLKAARLLPSGQVDDAEDLALLEVRDLLFARLLQYRAFKHVAQMFAELEAAALRSYPRAVSLEDRYEDLLPEVMLGVDAQRFAEIAATAFTPRPVPTVATEHLHELMVSVPEQAKQLMSLLEKRGIGQWASFSDLVDRLQGVDRDRRALPGSARAVSVAGGSIRPVRTAWCAPGFVDRRTTDQRRIAGPILMTQPSSDADLDIDAAELDLRMTCPIWNRTSPCPMRTWASTSRRRRSSRTPSWARCSRRCCWWSTPR